MRLSTIFELLLILLLVAFAAYGRVIDRYEATHRVARAANDVKQSDIDISTMSLKQATDSVNRYCTCNENICNCCRDFHIPLVQLKGPGCASLQYLQGDNLAVQLSFGDNILTSTMVNGKSPKPVCVPLPGGFTRFCGRIYSIQRDAKNHFKACLGLELQSPTDLEATLRVSCFRFGPDGLKLRPAEPLPTVETEATSEEDDDEDFFGLGSDDDDDDDEDDDRPITNSVPDASGVAAQDSDDDDDDDDLLGFSALLDIFTDDDVPTRPKVTTAAPLLEFTIPILPRPTTPAPLEDHELPTFTNNEQEINYEEHDDNTQEPFKTEEDEDEEEEEDSGLTESNTEDNTDENKEQITESSNKIVYTEKPDKAPTINKVKKGVLADKKKPTVTSTSVNAIHDLEKPAKKPIKDEEDDDDDDILDDDDEDDDDEDDEILNDDDDDDDDDDDKDDEDEEDDDKLDDNEKHEEHDDDDEDEKAEDLAELDDDDDEEEDAMLSALIGTGKSKKSKENTKTNQTNVHEHKDEDYDLGLEFFARKRHSRENRQSKITRL